ncbi:MAG: cupredoxin domain-containing protein [Anaerolineales bacterium]|nr:cupredoxin domain-containing protein [Anaerolineales bacterium]
MPKHLVNKAATLASGVLAGCAMLLAGCAAPAPAATPTPEATPTPVVQEVSLLALDMYWDIERIEARANQPLRITLRNDGALDHNFEILELEVSVFLSPGETRVVEFIVDRQGIFHYLCSIPGHEEAGMAGELVVGSQDE